MLNAFYNPEDAILDAKKLGGWGLTILVMICTAVLFAGAPLIALKSFIWKIPVVIIATFIIGAFLGGLFLKIAMSILKAKNPGYWEMVTSIVYGAAPLSAAVLIASLLSLIPKAGFILAILIGIVGVIASIAAHLRAVMELGETDLLTSAIASWLVASISSVAGYFIYSYLLILYLANMFAVEAAPVVVNATVAAVNATA